MLSPEMTEVNRPSDGCTLVRGGQHPHTHWCRPGTVIAMGRTIEVEGLVRAYAGNSSGDGLHQKVARTAKDVVSVTKKMILSD